MQKQHLLSTKVRFALPVMVLLYFLLTCLSFSNRFFSLQDFKGLNTERIIESVSGKSIFKGHAFPLEVGEATPANASSSGLVNELELLLAISLLLLIWTFFFFCRLPESLFSKPVWHLPFLHIYPLRPQGP